MSLVYFNGGADVTETTTLIKEKTGLELIYGDGSYGIFSCQVKFPDMADYETLSMKQPNAGKSSLCFVDVENHFFAYLSPQHNLNYYHSNLMINDLLYILLY